MINDEEIIDKALKGSGIPVDIRVNLCLCKNALEIQRKEIWKEIESLFNIFNRSQEVKLGNSASYVDAPDKRTIPETTIDRRQPGRKEGNYTTGALCECRHSHHFHLDGHCLKCDCREFRYLKHWKKNK